MAAPDDKLYEYAVIRYVPKVDREEFVNIGLIMLSKRNRWLKAMVILDDDRIKALYPDADLECLRNQSRLFEMKDVPAKDLPVEERYRWLTSVKSACLQVAPSHPGLLIGNPSINVKSEREVGTAPLRKSLNDDGADFRSDATMQTALEKEFERLFTRLVL